MKTPPANEADTHRFNSRPTHTGFSLIELLAVVAIGMVLASLTLPAMSQLRGGDMNASVEELSGVLENARTYAMARNTYTWVGLLPVDATDAANADKTDKVVVMVMAAKAGREADLAAGEVTPISKPRQLSRVRLEAMDAQVLSQAGREVQGNEDISISDLKAGFDYRLPMADNQSRSFTKIIQFGPTGDARIKQTASRTIEIGLKPARGDGANFAVLQVNGLTGQVRSFRP